METILTETTRTVTVLGTKEPVEVNKDALSAAIIDAEEIVESAKVGDKPGQYPKDAKADFVVAIEEAKAVNIDANATQEDVNHAVDKLIAALKKFNEQKNPDIKPEINPDVNGDEIVNIGDLAVVAYYYQTKDELTGMAKNADVNHDGKVDMEDLVIVSRAILSIK